MFEKNEVIEQTIEYTNKRLSDLMNLIKKGTISQKEQLESLELIHNCFDGIDKYNKSRIPFEDFDEYWTYNFQELGQILVKNTK